MILVNQHPKLKKFIILFLYDFYTLRFLLFSFFCLLFVNTSLKAQIIEVSIKQENLKSYENARVSNNSLFPFFDDFSDSKVSVKANLWEASENIRLSPDAGIKPPSFNVVVFDALKSDGNTYSENTSQTGKIDSLVSQKIDLGNLPTHRKENIFLSYFIEMGGSTNYHPEETDSLNLSFLDKDGEWNIVWSSFNKNISQKNFEQYFIKLNANYFHSEFQFKFQAYGNQSGKFDIWLLDYIQLAFERNGTKTPKLDRAINSRPNSLFKLYNQVPKKHLKNTPLSDNLSFSVFNLENKDYTVHYSVFVKDSKTGETLDTLGNQFQNFLKLNSGENKISVKNDFNIKKIKENTTEIETQVNCFTRDGGLIEAIINQDTIRYQNVNLEINDTISTPHQLSDYYAYDNGSAEAAGGVNQNGGQAAIRYVFHESSEIDSIGIYFPNTGHSRNGQPFNLKVYKSKNGFPHHSALDSSLHNTVLTSEDVFTKYPLSKRITVKDTLFISISGITDNFLAIGLDKENIPEDNILFQKISNRWEYAKKIGRLMIRPHLAKKIDYPEGTVLGDKTPKAFIIHPNPSHGRFEINVKFQNIKIFNLQGTSVPFVKTQKEHATSIKILEATKGIYVIKGSVNNKIYSQKIHIN